MKIIYLLILIIPILIAGCHEPVINNRIAVLETSVGTIKVELFEDKIPKTAENFIKLANSGFYDGTKFHRVIEGFMIQGGDPISKDDANKDFWGTGGPNYKIKDEFIEGLSNTRGTISMANSGPDTGGSQFFINVVDNEYLDFDKEPKRNAHAVFGQVIEGMHIVDKIASVKTDERDHPLENVVVERITIIEPSSQ